MALRIALLLFGVYACATAVIMIKASAVHPALLSAYRLFVAAVALTPLMIRDYRRHREQFAPRSLLAAILPGVLLGLHFISWIIGARKTPAANSSLIVNMVPIAMPFFLIVLIREKLTAGELVGTAISLGGMALLAAADFDVSREYFHGDVLCFVSMLLFAFYLALGRKNRGFASIWLYLVPLYYVAAVFCMGVALVLVNPIQPYSLKEILLILGLGLVPTVMGHSILNYSMKHLRGQVVSIVNLFQFVFAGIMGYFFYGEVPHWALYAASVALVAGVIVVLRSQQAAAPPAPPPDTPV